MPILHSTSRHNNESDGIDLEVVLEISHSFMFYLPGGKSGHEPGLRMEKARFWP